MARCFGSALDSDSYSQPGEGTRNYIETQDVVRDRELRRTTSSECGRAPTPPANEQQRDRPETMIERSRKLREEARAKMTPEERQREDEAREAAKRLREELARHILTSAANCFFFVLILATIHDVNSTSAERRGWPFPSGN